MSEASDYLKGLLDADEAHELSGAIDAALEISRRRGETLRRLRDALINGNDAEALSLARQYCGLEEKKPDA